MVSQWVYLVIMLIVILGAAELFTNALEHFGEKLKFSEGSVGSIFAAISTALPETIIPILALVAGTSNKNLNQEISVGAILGAPLMLSTLSTMLMGLSVIKKRGINGRIKPEKKGFIRDLNFFLIAFFLSASAMYVSHEWHFLRAFICIGLVSLYVGYLILTLKASNQLVIDGHGVQPSNPLVLTKFRIKNNIFSIIIQLLLSLVLLLLGAKGFINGIEYISNNLHISALLLSLLIIPIATELPEKVNSIIWVRKNKDTLGFGNITGAMVFQGTLLPALGIWLTPWQPRIEVLTGIIIAFIAAAWLRINASNEGIRIKALMVNGGLYITYLYLTLR